MTDCPHCGRPLGKCGEFHAAHATVTDTDEDGLRIDIACVCDECGGDIVIEDIPAEAGLIGTGYPGYQPRFEGKGYRI